MSEDLEQLEIGLTAPEPQSGLIGAGKIFLNVAVPASEAPNEDLRPAITAKVRELLSSGVLSDKQRAVLGCVFAAYRLDIRITRQEIGESEPWLGCHEIHEINIVANKRETTIREVAELIRQLRVYHDVPIIDYNDGYTLPGTLKEAADFLYRKEGEAKSRAKSVMITYNALKRSLGLQSEWFEAQPYEEDE